ncbi:MAG: deoxyribodipyrimidine photo-lyase [Alphaproteobacteria bacterium]|nr:deoxyribodipyrimidine photo-lyase [Alphaproteobacteria bacterium]
MTDVSLYWLRKDLRLSDNPALRAALSRGGCTVCVFILDTESEGALPIGAASAWWLHHSLTALMNEIEGLGGKLILRRGPSQKCLIDLCQETGATAVYWNRCYEPDAVSRDSEIKKILKEQDLLVESFNGSLLHEPWEVQTKAGGSYGVFSPFWKAEQALGELPQPIPAPKKLPALPSAIDSDALEDWSLLPVAPDWAGGLRESWTPGETGARTRLAAFLDEIAQGYNETRNRPDIEGTSRLSPHLAFGEISPREIWHIALDRVRADKSGALEKGVWSFLRELGWRDFNHNLLFYNPSLPDTNYNSRFDAFPWQNDPDAVTAWEQGKTGYPLVDAGMRELWHTGFMHNRVRMVVASFLIKHLMIDWRVGEAWFRDTLVDADLANNVANWQWTAGCGADAAPYFRIFNPIGQGEKFDPDGLYIRHWVPELKNMPTKYLNKPWEAPPDILKTAGVNLGKTYPKPIVSHIQARNRALDAYNDIKGAA